MQQLPGQQPAPGIDKTGLIAMLVVLALVTGYELFIGAPRRYEIWQKEKAAWEAHQRKEAAKREGAKREGGDAAAVGSETPAGNAPRDEPPVPSAPSAPRDEAIAFETPEHEVTLSTAGASVHRLTFKDILESTYKPSQSREEDLRQAGPFQPLHPYLPEVRAFALRPLDPKLADVATRDWHHEAREGGVHEFWTELPDGLVLRKTFFPPEATTDGTTEATTEGATEGAKAGKDAPRLYHMRLRVRIENPTDTAKRFGYYLYGPGGMVEEDLGRASYGHEYVLATRDEQGRATTTVDVATKLEKVGAADVSVSGKVAYWGLATKYFTALAVPTLGTRVTEADAQGLVQSTGKVPSDKEREPPDAPGRMALTRGLVPEVEVGPDQAQVQEFLLYVGPRQAPEVFAQPVYAQYDLDELVYFGWFGSMGRLLVWVLQGLHAVVGNWGVAILLLTFIVRGLLMPLSMWSQRNMFRMQKLGPEINKLKEKYTNKDGGMSREQQQAFQAAQMELWRKHEVNPVGCIGPLFLQMPIFIGLYNALNYSFPLRHSEFALWISDLSQPDVLFRLPFSIPLLGTNAFSVLPLVMVATYVFQQQLQPTPTDERMAEQQRMMKWIMPLFGFLFYTMPSGLMLYFITSSLWGIAEQKAIKAKIEAQEGPLAPAPAAALAGGGKDKKAKSEQG